MPQFEIEFEGKDQCGRRAPDGLGLAWAGPILQVVVAVPPPLVKSLAAAERPVPGPQKGMALIDTGASKTAVDESIISILEISPNGETTMGTAAGLRKASLHAVQTSFPAMMTQGIFLPQAVSCDLSGQKVPGGQLAVLLGRDLLRHFLMIYNGPRDRVTLLPG